MPFFCTIHSFCYRIIRQAEAEGLIKLDPEAGITATENDIVENPHNIKIVPLAAEQVARTLEDVDFGVINGNYAMEAGLTSADAVALESADSEAIQQYVNVVAVKEGNENNEGVQALVKILKSDEIKDFINEKYDGAVIPFDDSADTEDAAAEETDSKDTDSKDEAKEDAAEENAETTEAAEDAE